MKERKSPAAREKLWRKSNFANLVRHVPSGVYFARLRLGGKLIRRPLHTTVITTARLRLAGLEKLERTTMESQPAGRDGALTFGGALSVYCKRLNADRISNPAPSPARRSASARC